MGAWRCGVMALAMMLAGAEAGAETVRLGFLHVNDIYEYKPVDGDGGLAELGSLLEAERARLPSSLLSFGGDLLSPSLASNLTKGEHMIAFLNALGVAVAVPGNHEFDFGPDVFAARLAESRFPWLGTNIRDAGGGNFASLVPTALRTLGGVRVGFLGVLTPETPNLSNTGSVVFSDEVEAARKAAEDLRRQGAEVVVALTHLDLEQDRRLAARVKAIDLILGGHDHDPVSIREGGALILKAGHNAEWLGEVELEVERPDAGASGPVVVRPVAWRFVTVRGQAPSPALASLVAATDRRLGEGLDEPLATLEVPLDSRPSAVRGGEAAWGNLVADALRRHFQADAALVNGGGLRGNRQYAAGGSLSRRDVLAELPFGNTVQLLEVSGRQLRDALEHGLSAPGLTAGRFPQVSGLSVSFDPARPPGQRVLSVQVGGKPLDAARLYRLAVPDFLARGGDGYAMLTAAKVLVDSSAGPLMPNVVADDLALRGRVEARIEGRVRPVR